MPKFACFYVFAKVLSLTNTCLMVNGKESTRIEKERKRERLEFEQKIEEVLSYEIASYQEFTVNIRTNIRDNISPPTVNLMIIFIPLFPVTAE